MLARRQPVIKVMSRNRLPKDKPYLCSIMVSVFLCESRRALQKEKDQKHVFADLGLAHLYSRKLRIQHPELSPQIGKIPKQIPCAIITFIPQESNDFSTNHIVCNAICTFCNSLRVSYSSFCLAEIHQDMELLSLIFRHNS